MDEAVRLLIIALVTFFTSVLAAWGMALKGRADVAKAAEEARVAREVERNKSEAAFREAFSAIKRDFDEERRKNDRLEKRLDALSDAHQQDAGEIANLTQRLNERDAAIAQLESDLARISKQFETLKLDNQHLTETLLQRTSERDAALVLVNKQNGELKQREHQIALLTADLETTKQTLATMQERLAKLEQGEAVKAPNEAPASAPATETDKPKEA